MDLFHYYQSTPIEEIDEALIPFIRAYRSHDPIPEFSKDERIDKVSHCNMKGLIEDTEYL